MARESRKTGEFLAVADDGHQYRILEFKEFIDNPTLGGPGRPIPGPKRLETADGQRVNFKAPGVFEIVDSGLIVRTVK